MTFNSGLTGINPDLPVVLPETDDGERYQRRTDPSRFNLPAFARVYNCAAQKRVTREKRHATQLQRDDFRIDNLSIKLFSRMMAV